MKKIISVILVFYIACNSPAPSKLSLTKVSQPGFVTVPGTTYDASNWNITGTVTLKNNVKWKGGHFTGTGAAFTSLGNCINVSIDSILLDSSLTTLFDGNIKPFVTYNASDSTFLYKNVTASHVKISGKTTLYNGTFEGPKTFHDVNYGMTITDVDRTLDSNSENQIVSGQSIYRFRFARWNLIGNGKVRYPNGNTLVDNGVVQINSGNGQGRDCYRNGKQAGYWFRNWGVKLGSDTGQDSRLENCVDVKTSVYGTMDFRIDPGLLQSNAPIPLRGIDAYFINNTSAYKEDINNGYVTCGFVAGQTRDDIGNIFTVHIKNSLGFGAHVSSMSASSLFKNNSSGVLKIDSSGNIDIPPGKPVPAGLVDSNFYALTKVGAQKPSTPVPPIPPVTDSVKHDTIYIKLKVIYPTYDGKTWHYYFEDGSVQ
jgi:hypothetical protein